MFCLARLSCFGCAGDSCEVYGHFYVIISCSKHRQCTGLSSSVHCATVRRTVQCAVIGIDGQDEMINVLN